MKLVLFDIDGTLVSHHAVQKHVGFPRFEYAIKHVYGVEVFFGPGTNYNGWVDKHIVRWGLRNSNINNTEFEKKWPKIADALLLYAKKQTKEAYPQKLYAPILDAVDLAQMVSQKKDVKIGVITGNVEKMALWKLKHAKINHLFSFGVFSDKFEDRMLMAKSVFRASQDFFHISFQPKDVTVIGDSIHDIRCGKAIGAKTIAVTTGILTSIGGIHGGPQYVSDLKKEQPDLLVDSLRDKAVLDFLGLIDIQKRKT